MMRSARPLFIECLEARIAPAGIITIEVVDSELVVAGRDDITKATVTEEPDGTWIFIGREGTRLKFGHTGAEQEQVMISAGDMRVIVDLGSSDDELVFQGVTFAKAVTVRTGDGANNLIFEDCALARRLTVTGGSAADTVQIRGERFLIGGDVAISLGDGSNHTEFSGAVLKIAGDLKIDVAGSEDHFAFQSGRTNIQESLSFNLPFFFPGQEAVSPMTIVAEGGVFKVGTDLTIHAAHGNDRIALNPSSLLRVGSAIYIDDTGGSDEISIATGTNECFAGSIDVRTDLVRSSRPPANDQISITPDARLSIINGLGISLDQGNHVVRIGAEVVEVGWILDVFLDAVWPSEVLLHGGAHFSVGGLSLNSGGGSTYSVEVAGDLVVSGGANLGSAGVPNGDPTAVRKIAFSASTVTFGSYLTIAAAPAGLDASIRANALHVGRSLQFLGRDATDINIEIDVRMLTAGGIGMKSERSTSVGFHLDVVESLNISGLINISQLDATDALVEISAGSGSIGGINITTDATRAATVSVQSRQSPLTIGTQINVLSTGGTASTQTILGGVQIGDTFTYDSRDAFGRSGDDLLTIDDIAVGSRAVIRTGEGSDNVSLETVSTSTRAVSTFHRTALVDLGAGDDTFTIGRSGDARLRAAFLGRARFIGGPDIDQLQLANNSMFPLGEPTVSEFEPQQS